MARPAGEIRTAVVAAFARLVAQAQASGKRGVTIGAVADALVPAQISRGATRRTAEQLVREGLLLDTGDTQRIEGVCRPAKLYALAQPATAQRAQPAIASVWACAAAMA